MMPVEQVEDFRGTPSFYGVLPRMVFLFRKGETIFFLKPLFTMPFLCYNEARKLQW